MARSVVAALVALAALAGFAGEAPAEKPKPDAPKKKELAPGTYARIKTEKGDMVIRLLPDKAPETVENFIGLAKGERPFKDKDGRWVSRPYFDGLTFHRSEKGELIQGGCPKGDGTGGPGYQFDNESADDLDFETAGRVAMANAGRDTNGSQFFITLRPSPAYNNRYTIFGEVAEGLGVAKAIAEVPVKKKGNIHLALKPVVMQRVTIEVIEEPKDEKAPEAKKEEK